MPPIHIDSIHKFLKILRGKLPPDRPVWFRGHSDATWELRPSVHRPPRNLQSEFPAFKRFQQSAHQYLTDFPENDWDWLFLMQHFGIPTRLLDWTENPLVALFFSVESQDKMGDDGCVWALFPQDLNHHSGYNLTHRNDIPAFSIDSCLEQYRPKSVLDVLATNPAPMAALAPRKFSRIVAQHGVFVIYHRDPTPLDEFGDGKHVQKFIVPARAKGQIAEELKLLRMTDHTVYPELERAAKFIKDSFS